jgi:hypothetical protein
MAIFFSFLLIRTRSGLEPFPVATNMSGGIVEPFISWPGKSLNTSVS